MLSSIQLREAMPSDKDVLQYWDEQPHIIASDPNDDWQWENELKFKPSWRQQLIAELNGKPIGFVQIIDPQFEDSGYWGEVGGGKRAIDIWIGEQENLNKGYGTLMMREALSRCFASPEVMEIWIDPLEQNTAARRFYERLGFEFLEIRRFGKDVCAVYRLTRATFQNRR